MSGQDINTVAVIGCGTIGASWAALFLANGLAVRCSDPSPNAEAVVRAYVERAWDALTALRPGLPKLADALARLSFHASAGAAAEAADFVQENAPERMDLKRALYREIEAALPPGRILATSTSGLRPSDLQAELTRPETFVVGHPFNPPHLVPLVEVVGGTATAAATIETAMQFYTAMGKRAIHVRKEVPGHVANRLQAALWREAVHLAAEGVASVADIDAAVVAGPGLRWAIMGPHMTFHLAAGDHGMAGFIDHLGPAVETWWADLGQPTLDAPTSKVVVEGVEAEAGTRDLKSLWTDRDAALLDLLKTRSPL